MCFYSGRVTNLIGARVQDNFFKPVLGTKLVVYYFLHFSVLAILAGKVVFQISAFIHYPSQQSRIVLCIRTSCIDGGVLFVLSKMVATSTHSY